MEPPDLPMRIWKDWHRFSPTQQDIEIMHYRPLYLINDQSEKVALLDVKWQGTHFEGTVILETLHLAS